MALQRQGRGGALRLLAVALAVGMIATVGLFALPSARAAFTPPGLRVANSIYWGGHTFVPGEAMSITLLATAGDSINLLIQNASTNPQYTNNGIIIPNTGQLTLSWPIPTTWPDGTTYSVQATDTNSAQVRTVAFAIESFRLSAWSNRFGYLVGDSVTVSWSAVLAQNGAPAPTGMGVLEVLDSAGASLLPTAQYNFTASQGNYTFTLGSAVTVPDFKTIFVWFNDTAGLRQATDTSGFGVGNLGVNVNVPVPTRGYFEPGEPVTATIRTTITGIGGGVYEPNVPVSVNVTDLATGLPVAGYSNAALTSDSDGALTYIFQLGLTPTSGSYQVTATATAHGTLSATTSAPPFNVRPPPSFTASVMLNKAQYLSGETVGATALVVSLGTQTFTYTWTVTDSAGNILAYWAGGTTGTTYSYPTATTFQGLLFVQLRVDNGTGGVVFSTASARVAVAYLSVSLDRTQFNPGDVITATASVASNVITSPTYLWTVQDAAGSAVAAGSMTSGTASFTTPSPSSSRYVFLVTATQGGWTAQASQTASRIDGYLLSLSFDRSSYNPGDTMTITYTVTARGVSTLPAAYHFSLQLLGVGFKTVDASSPTGTLTFQIPGNSPTGNLLLYVFETNTGAAVYNVVHVGAVNPLVADVGGVPLFDILITLLFVVLLLAVILLWRRGGMGRTPSGPETARPSTPPPPPPSGPSQQSAGPMSVACKHCGASIEITTSKRPIEVMCPSCGETQVVQ